MNLRVVDYLVRSSKAKMAKPALRSSGPSQAASNITRTRIRAKNVTNVFFCCCENKRETGPTRRALFSHKSFWSNFHRRPQDSVQRGLLFQWFCRAATSILNVTRFFESKHPNRIRPFCHYRGWGCRQTVGIQRVLLHAAVAWQLHLFFISLTKAINPFYPGTTSVVFIWFYFYLFFFILLLGIFFCLLQRALCSWPERESKLRFRQSDWLKWKKKTKWKRNRGIMLQKCSFSIQIRSQNEHSENRKETIYTSPDTFVRCESNPISIFK